MSDKPKTALDWIQWARGNKKKKAAAAPPPAKPPAASPAGRPAWLPAEPQAKPAPAASPEPVVSEQAPVQEPPAPPTKETVDETPGRGTRDKALDDLDDLENLPDVDDFDRLMAEVSECESSDAPAPAPAPAKAPAPTPTRAKAPAPAPTPTPTRARAKAPAPTRARAKAPAPAPQAAGPQLPAASNSTVFIPEQSAYAFAASDFNFIEADGGELTYVEIISLAGDGSLRFDHAEITMGQKIAKADIDAGSLVFIPDTAKSSVGHDSFLYKVHDGKSCSRGAYTMTIEAIPVSD